MVTPPWTTCGSSTSRVRISVEDSLPCGTSGSRSFASETLTHDVRLTNICAINELTVESRELATSSAIIEILCVYRTFDTIETTARADTSPMSVRATSRPCRPAIDPRRPTSAPVARTGRRRHRRRRDRSDERRSELHDVAGARSGGDPRLHAAEAQPDDLAALPSHRHSARRGASLPLYAFPVGLCRRRGRQELLVAAEDPRPGPRVPVVDHARQFRAAAARPRERPAARILVDRAARRGRDPVRRPLVDDAPHHVGGSRHRHPAARVLHVDGTRAARVHAAGRPRRATSRGSSSSRTPIAR